MYYLFGFLPLLLLLLLLLFWLVCVCSLFRQVRRHKPRRRSQKRRHKPSVLHKHCLSESPPSFIFEITHLHLQSSCLSNAVPRHQLDYMSSISIQFGDDPFPSPPAPKTTSIASFFVKEQTKIEPELSAEEQKKLDDDWNIKMTEKEDRKALRVSVLAQACKAWQIPITEPRPWGTKKKSVMWDDKLRDLPLLLEPSPLCRKIGIQKTLPLYFVFPRKLCLRD